MKKRYKCPICGRETETPEPCFECQLKLWKEEIEMMGDEE